MACGDEALSRPIAAHLTVGALALTAPEIPKEIGWFCRGETSPFPGGPGRHGLSAQLSALLGICIPAESVY